MSNSNYYKIMEAMSWLFWKNVNHVRWLAIATLAVLFVFNKPSRDYLLLLWACYRVERQDEYRVWYLKTIKPIEDLLKDLTTLMKSTTSLHTLK